MGSEVKQDKPVSRLRKWLRRLGKLAVGGVVFALVLWFAIHQIPWLGPALADGVRSVLGPAPVAWAEDVAYGIQDRVNMWRYKDTKPKVFWEAPPSVASAISEAKAEAKQKAASAAEAARFAPKPFAPPHPSIATPGEGSWIPIADPRQPDAPVVMYKSLVHPDPRRGFAALAVVAVDLSSFKLELVAGTTEPKTQRVKRTDRPGLVPSDDQSSLLAAFNGGFKATHGQYGMMLDGVEYLPPRDFACTFVKNQDNSFLIGTWSEIKAGRENMKFFRQTPPCLVENGDIHKTLHYNEYAKTWGATVSGDTVIRRSAIGLDKDRKILFYGLGEGMTAQALAQGMKAAGADAAAELDVNFSYPRMLFYEHPGGEKSPIAKTSIIPNIDFTSDQYVRRPSIRDFFYLARQSRQAQVGSSGQGRFAAAD